MTVWRLKKGADRRVRQGHPWVFASELAHSAREIAPGAVIELRDSQDHFLAYGYGHPSSQICFRKLTAKSRETDVLSVDFFTRRLQAARDLRRSCGWTSFSHRWLYAEADGVPGLVVDAFMLEERSWLAVIQASTAGMDKAVPAIAEALRGFSVEFGALTVVEAPSSRARVLEGLAVTDKKIIYGDMTANELTDAPIGLLENVRLRCDLLHGQKTGFFLDQQWNASVLKRQLRARTWSGAGSPPSGLRILDICCYVGQWASHAVQAVRSADVEVEVTLVDSSAAALALASRNVEAQGATAVSAVEGDALKQLASLPEQSFDIVICDPPAFVKKKADLEPGLRAYTKLFRDALRLCRPGACMVLSSCSGLVRPADFQRAAADAAGKAGRLFQVTATGGHGPDHPLRPEFPEGEYLKCLIGTVNYPF
jgi:23S rRNA (cytosine1962-C5)-methyltransferase